VVEPAERCFIDSNIFLYAAGEPSLFKDQCLSLLGRLTKGNAVAVTNTAVLEEVHFVYFRQTGNVRECLRLLQDIRSSLGEILPMTEEVLLMAWRFFHTSSRRIMSVKDYYHAASMHLHGIKTIVSYDGDFDLIPGLRRIDPRNPMPLLLTDWDAL